MNTIEANQLVHGYLARSGEYDKSPHFYPENKEFVKQLIQEFLSKSKILSEELFSNCLDLGCGTGFMFDIISEFPVAKYVGIDITQDMLDVFSKKYPSAQTIIANAESLPFDDSYFSFVCNYSFLDHLENLDKVFAEAYRVLQTDGIFYSGLIPSSDYSKILENGKSNATSYLDFAFASQLNREYNSMFNNGKIYADQYGLEPDILEKAEPQKTKSYGLLASQIKSQLQRLGFVDITICPNWFFAQSSLKNDPSSMKIIDEYLKQLGPLGSHLFKYFDIFARKV